MSYPNWYQTLSAAPAAEPVTQVEAKLHMRVDITEDNDYIDALIAAARRMIERETDIRMVDQTWILNLERYPTTIRLPYYPVDTITSIEYVNIAGTLTTENASVYTLFAPTDGPAVIDLAHNQSWSTTRAVRNAVVVTYVVGFGAAAVVPETLKTAVKMLAAHWYEHREAVSEIQNVKEIPMAVRSLIDAEASVEFV